MDSAVVLPAALSADLLTPSERLALQGAISQFFPGDRVKIILQGDGLINIEGMEARFAALILGRGRNVGKKAKLNALTPEGLIDRSKETALKWQNDNV